MVAQDTIVELLTLMREADGKRSHYLLTKETDDRWGAYRSFSLLYLAAHESENTPVYERLRETDVAKLLSVAPERLQRFHAGYQIKVTFDDGNIHSIWLGYPPKLESNLPDRQLELQLPKPSEHVIYPYPLAPKIKERL